MVFKPSLDYGVADGFFDLVDSLVGDIYKQASKIPRLAVHIDQENYQVFFFPIIVWSLLKFHLIKKILWHHE